MLVPLCFQMPYKRSIPFIAVNFSSLLMLMLYYWPHGESVSSMWCFTNDIYV